MQLQQTVKKSYSFVGKGLHTGKIARMTVCPAPEDTGIVFRRTDLGEDALVPALAENVSNTARSTTISRGEASVSTIEHIMSALTGLGIDNAFIDIDNVEVPILDGSAKPYIDAMWKDGVTVQPDATVTVTFAIPDGWDADRVVGVHIEDGTVVETVSGFGGKTTALCVNIETLPTHIAGLPVAVNINCHVTRHKTEVL